MIQRTRFAVLPLLMVSLAVSAQAQKSSVVTDLINDVSQVEQKLVALAKAFPGTAYGWRPAPTVRSVGEVMLHVASDNYLIPAAVGHSAPAATGITTDYKTAEAFEKRTMSPEQTVKEMQASFAHLKSMMSMTTEADMKKEVTMFGSKMTMQQVWILTATHLHEHLGQAIAYARSNGVKPPWS